MKKPSVNTEAWLAYDDNNLYLSVRCIEPNLDKLVTKTTKRDGRVWQDDSIEFMIDTNLDRKTYFHFVANAAGVIYDGMKTDKSTGASKTKN